MRVIARPMVDGSALTSDEWCTPKWLCGLLGRFDLDPCSNDRSHIDSYARCSMTGDHRDNIAKDGVAFNWREVRQHRDPISVFCNPPYSDVGPWAAKLAEHQGAWVALLKLDPTTRWWTTLMSANPTVAPFRKRIKFEGDKPMTANFPSVLVYKRWAPSDELAQHLWLQRWA